MRRLRGSAPSGASEHCGGVSFMRRLRRSASEAFFIVFVICSGVHILCAGCVDPRPLLGLPGVVSARLGSPGLSWLLWDLFCALLGSSGLSWARLGSPGLSKALLSSPGRPGLSWAVLGFPVVFWARLASPGLFWATLGSPGLVWDLPRHSLDRAIP